MKAVGMKAVGLVLALALAGGLSCFAEGVTYYVATNGDDASTTPTDPATPLKTLAEAYNRASDGDTVSIATGTYKLGATVTVAKGVTFTSTSGVTEDVKVDGGTTIRPFILDHADAKLYKITVQRGKASAGSYSIGGNVWIRRAGGTVDSCVLRGGNAAAYSSRGGTGGAGDDPGGAGNGGGGGAIGCNSAAGVIVN